VNRARSAWKFRRKVVRNPGGGIWNDGIGKTRSRSILQRIFTFEFLSDTSALQKPSCTELEAFGSVAKKYHDQDSSKIMRFSSQTRIYNVKMLPESFKKIYIISLAE